MKIKISSEQELIDVATEAIHLLSNLRDATKKWEDGFGSERKRRKKRFEELSDEFLEQIQVKEHKHPESIKIEINDQNIL